MKGNQWVVAAKVGDSVAAKRTDPSGDMETLELMELILVSQHETRPEAEQAARSKRSARDGWVYIVMRKRDFDAQVQAV